MGSTEEVNRVRLCDEDESLLSLVCDSIQSMLQRQAQFKLFQNTFSSMTCNLKTQM